MKILFAGTPDFATAPLRAIIEKGFDVVGVITQADKPQGRKAVLTPPPVKVLAQAYNIPVYQPLKIKDETELLQSLNAHPSIEVTLLGIIILLRLLQA